MQLVLAALRAKLLEFQPVRVIAPIFLSRIVALFAFGAS
jgi:hypothetical protein